jgi:hypothetical protein
MTTGMGSSSKNRSVSRFDPFTNASVAELMRVHAASDGSQADEIGLHLIVAACSFGGSVVVCY